MTIVMKLALSMSYPLPTLLKKMVLLKRRTRHSSPLQEQCWMSMALRRSFGPKQSTRRVMLPTGFIFIGS
uniref:Uncharacterized protein n=1 Tax=Arundo donax TaxID=35708 RepID=A0A0A9CGX6_ARUDO